MTRLESELHRLYLPHAADAAGQGVKGLALELAGRASWEQLAPLWQGVQADLELPAPGIAVSGVDGYQLWFSLAEPVPLAEAQAFLRGLRRRYLAQVPTERIRMRPTDAATPDVTGMPPGERAPGCWSAFVAPDLAALFAEEPWLDLPPGQDAQAELLSRLQSTKPADLQRALARLAAQQLPERSSEADRPARPLDPSSAAAGPHPDPRSFLLAVMNDPAIDLRLRIEAAKALLPCFEGKQPPAG